MATTVSISPAVLESIRSGQWSGQGIKGFLVGRQNLNSSLPDTVLAVWQSKLIDTNELKEDIDECLSHFPGGTTVIGVVLLPSKQSMKSIQNNEESGIDREFEEAFGTYGHWLEQMGLSEAIVLCLWPQSAGDEQLQYAFFMVNAEEAVTKIDVNQNASSTPTVRFRLKADVPLIISTESNSEEQVKNALDQELTKFLNLAQSGGFVFGFDDNRIIMQEKGTTIGSMTGSWSKCVDINKYLARDDGGGGSRRKGAGLQQQMPVGVSMLQMSHIESPGSIQYAPIIRHHIGSFHTTRLSMPLDILIEVEETFPVSDLPHVLTKALTRQISAMFECLSVYTQDRLHTPEAFHFKPPSLDTSVTVIYPKGASESELEKERQILHQHLCLPMTQPLLRRAAAGFFLQQKAPGGYLLNTHIGLPDPPAKSATISLVDGYYSYHHYMQDHFDDDKWGCAYRSLQTIVSWFKYQGFTEKNIPSHRDIQQALFEVGDKEQKFVGSRQWIGSFEVSYVLDHLLGVTSKFINVNAGSELATVGQQLANHFQTQGTPIMIGGGVLAHTILGVAYSELTGDINFLILDPHYTGGEDIRVIQDKGWCGWKDMNFWNQTAHYNMCLPQRPQVI